MAKANVIATTDRRVAQVVAIIGRDKARADEIERKIRWLDEEQRPSGWWPPGPHNKQDKLIGQSLGRALGKLEKQLGRYDGSQVLAQALYGWGPPYFAEFKTQLKFWRECFESFGGKPQFAGSLFNHEDLTWRLGRPKPSAERFRRKHNAVAAAASILESHGLPLTATHKSSTKASVFCRVAAVVFGDPRANLYHQCRVFIESRNRVSK